MAFDFQALLHTYLRVQNGQALDKNECFVKGLQGYSVHDKITDEKYVLEDDTTTPVTIDTNVDRVYTPPPSSSSSSSSQQSLQVHVGTGAGTQVALTASASVDGVNDVPVSCVIWNPHKEKAAAMSDFTNEEYVDMICVEPGILSNGVVCRDKAVLSQTITTLGVTSS
jgi:glucose-6-phosphate 1-epimerase